MAITSYPDGTIICSANDTYTLPTAVGVDGSRYLIKNAGSGTVVVNCTDSQTIDGLTSISLLTKQSLRVLAEGGNWIKISNAEATEGGEMTGDQIRTALGISVLSGSNTGDQDITGKVDKVTGSSLVPDTAIANIHAPGSDNQDLSGLQPKETGKGLSTNDYTTAEQTKLAGIAAGATVGADWNTNVTNKPTIPAAQVQTDWNASAGIGVLLNKPTIPVGGTPALKLGTANTAGSSPNFLRRDDTILAFDATAPSTQAFGDSAVVGSATVASRSDHKHAMMSSPKDTTAQTGILKGNGSAISAAAASDITGQLITGYVSGAGTVAATDSILQALQKINGNDALKAPLSSPSLTTPNIGAATGTSLAVTGAVTSSGGGVGYATGAGGTQTQSSSKSTGVTLSKLCGTITMNGAALAAATTVSFTLTNTFIAAGDFVNVQHASVGTLGAYTFAVAPASGSVVISVRNVHTASLSEAIVLRFVIIKAVTA